MPKYLRMLANYVPSGSTPSTLSNRGQYNFFKDDIVSQESPPTDGWILVRVIRHYDTVPGWVPADFVTEAQPGYYRSDALDETRWNPAIYKDDIVKVTKIGVSPMALLVGGVYNGMWTAKVFNTDETMYLWPSHLRPVDVHLPAAINNNGPTPESHPPPYQGPQDTNEQQGEK